MIDLRLTLGVVWVVGFWGVMSVAAEHAHCNTTINSTQLSDEGNRLWPT